MPDDRTSDSLDRLVADLGVCGRRLGNAIDAMLDNGGLTTMVRRSGLPRRTVERLLGVDADVAALRQVRAAIGVQDAEVPAPDAQAVDRMQAIIDAAPKAKRQLDHVGATAETAARRAAWLAGRFVLAGRRLVLAGDHDLTSLAAAALLADTDIVVVDVDDRLLDFIAHAARSEGLSVTCVYADLTVALPASVAGSAQVVFTDPPYTPAGVATFVARSVEAIDRRQPARIVMAYGFSPEHPALGLQVQRQLIGLELAIEAIEPGFNRYEGAQAIGSRSDLYTLMPTSRSLPAASRLLASATQAIYTHGERSLESRTTTLAGATRAALLERAEIANAPDAGDAPSVAWVAGGSGRPVAELTSARQLFDQVGQPHVTAVAATLLDGADAWLGRVLLAARADRLALLVPNSHPDIVSAAAQAALSALVAGKYELAVLRSQPSDHTAIVVAARLQQPAVTLPDRPAATLRTALHDLLYKGSRDGGAQGLSKPEVTTLVDVLLAEVGADYAAVSVADLPRSVIAAVSRLVADRAARTSGSSR